MLIFILAINMMKKDSSVYQLKVTLSGSHPPIWRRILILSDVSFFDLHVAIQDAMGWFDSHLHQFFVGSPYGRDSLCLSYPYADLEPLEETKDERHEKLFKHLHKEDQRVYYEYDFGDGWMHEIRLEKILPFDATKNYPQLVKGVNACPPEDCGGIGGYYDLLEILKDPKNPDHQERLEWLNMEEEEAFDPEFFDLEDVVFQDPKDVEAFYKDMQR